MLKVAQFALALVFVLACTFFYGWLFYAIAWRVMML